MGDIVSIYLGKVPTERIDSNYMIECGISELKGSNQSKVTKGKVATVAKWKSATVRKEETVKVAKGKAARRKYN